MKRLSAEAFGTFWLVFCGCGTAVLAACVPELGIGYAGVALAFGLAILIMGYAVGHISGGHFNPAVSLGMAMAGRFDYKDVVPYWAAQIIGGTLGGLAIFIIAVGMADFAPGAFASSGFDDLSPGGYSVTTVVAVEVILTAIFVIVFLGATSPKAPARFAPIIIGVALTLIHFVSSPVGNTSVNPARSIAAAIFAETGAMGQVWVFLLAPLVGAALGATLWKSLLGRD